MPLVWTEINLNAPQASLAGRGDSPATNRGEGVAAVVSFASAYLNERSLNWRIQREFTNRVRQAEVFFTGVPPTDRRRLLAEVWVAARRVDSMTGRTYMDTVFHRLTNDPLSAIRQIRNTPRIGPRPAADSDQRESRWFLGQRS